MRRKVPPHVWLCFCQCFSRRGGNAAAQLHAKTTDPSAALREPAWPPHARGDRFSLLLRRGGQELASRILFCDLLRRDKALNPEADVFVKPRLAIVGLKPCLSALLLQGVEGRPRSEASQEGLSQAGRLIHVGFNPALVPIA